MASFTYPLTLPTVTGIRSHLIRPRAAVAVTRSPFTNEAEVFAHPGQWFEAEVTLPVMKRASFAQWQAFRMKLNGQEGTFTMGISDLAVPRGTASASPGTPLVNGASQTGDQLIIDGAPANETGWLKEMDLIQIGSGLTARLYIVLVDVNTDALGNATIDVWPDITAANSPADNDPVVVSNCVGLWRMSANSMPWDADEAALYGLSFNAISEA